MKRILGIGCLIAAVSSAQAVELTLPISKPLVAAEQAALKTITARRGTKAAIVVVVDFPAFDAPELSVPTTEGKRLVFVGRKTMGSDGRAFSWVGRSSSSSDPRAQPATASFSSDGKGSLEGLIRDQGRVYRISDLGRFHLIAEVEVPAFVEPPIPEPPNPPPPRATPSSSQKVMPLEVGDPTIRVLTVYTSNAQAYLGNVATVTQEQTSLLNQSFRDSGVRLHAVSAGHLVVNNSVYVSNVVNAVNTARSDLVILQARDDAFADVVMLVIDSPDVNQGYAAQVYATADSAFAAVQAASLPDLTYAHEIGHLLGARHQAAGGVPSSSNDSNNYPYAHGHGRWVRDYDPGFTTVCFHTIMSYPSATNSVSCPFDEHVLRWSNPSIYYRGVATGASNAHNAAVLNTLGPAATSFRNTKLAPSMIGAILQNAVSAIILLPD